MNEYEIDALLDGKHMRPVTKGKPVLPPVAKNNLYKTQLCRNYMSTGKYKYGRVCSLLMEGRSWGSTHVLFVAYEMMNVSHCLKQQLGYFTCISIRCFLSSMMSLLSTRGASAAV